MTDIQLDKLVKDYIYHNTSDVDATQECYDICTEIARRDISPAEFSELVYQERKKQDANV